MANYRILQETGEFLLQETTDKILLDGYIYTEVTKSLQYVCENTVAYKVDLNLGYTVKITQSPVEKSLSYAIRQTIGAIEKSLGYTVTITQTAKIKSLVYTVKSIPSAIEKSLKYTVFVTASPINKSLKYCVLTTPNRLFIYRLQQEDEDYILQENGGKITLDGIGDGEKRLEYTVTITQTPKTKSLEYTVSATIPASEKQLKYTVVTAIGILKSLVYKIKAPESVRKYLKYTVFAPVVKSRSLRYLVTITQPAKTKSLAYTFKFPHLVGNGKRLDYRILTNNENIELYHTQNQTYGGQYTVQSTVYASKYSVKSTGYVYYYRVEEHHGIAKSLTYVIS